MIIRLTTIFVFFIFVFSSVCFAEEAIEVTTYYPAPYGDYENIRINTAEVYNLVVNPDPNDTSVFRPVFFYNKLRVLRQLCQPYDATYTDSLVVPDFIDIDAENNRMVFSQGQSGIFFVDNDVNKSYEQGIVFDSNVIALRNKGDIYLQPGFTEGIGYGFVQENDDDGNVIVEGDLKVNVIEVRDGQNLLLKVGTKNISIKDSKIVIDPGGTQVVIGGNLRVTGDLKVDGTSSFGNITMDRLTTREIAARNHNGTVDFLINNRRVAYFRSSSDGALVVARGVDYRGGDDTV